MDTTDSTRSFGIVPAAGDSLRMGCNKLLLPWGQTTVIGSVLAAWKASHVSATVVVVRPDDESLVAACRAAGVDVVVPPVSPTDMKASVQYALRHIENRYRPQDSDVWLVAPAVVTGSLNADGFSGWDRPPGPSPPPVSP